MKKRFEYQSVDLKYSVNLSESINEDLVRYIKNANKNETGGILIGNYNDLHDLAYVCSITGPTADSKSGKTWFLRGVKTLQNKINDLWIEKQYYLGEWHYHPNAPAFPSFQDNAQMRKILEDKKYKCPEPLLLIIGGSVSTYEIRLFVFCRSGTRVDLIEKSKALEDNL